MSEPKKYIIREVKDLQEVPLDKLGVCLLEIEDGVKMAVEMGNGVVLEQVEWFDDGRVALRGVNVRWPMTEPRKCQEPGCGREMVWQFEGIMPDGRRRESRVCPATPEHHEIAALQSQLDTAMKQVAMLREAILPVLAISDRKHDAWDALKFALSDTSSADQWLAAHDWEVLGKAWEQIVRASQIDPCDYDQASIRLADLRAAILGTEEAE